MFLRFAICTTESTLNKLKEFKESTTSELIEDLKDLEIGKLDSMIKRKLKDIKEIEKKGHQTYVYDFFNNKNKEYKNVLTQSEALDICKYSIQEFIKKANADMVYLIQNSIQLLSKYFKLYFSYFVEDAQTSIKFIRSNINEKEEQKSSDENEEDNSAEQEPEVSASAESTKFTVGEYQYLGVSVKVSFKNNNIMQTMKELSGGEKTVVSLSLLLAFTALINNKIYLLDEVDAALDQEYRIKLTELLTKISHDRAGTQFFMTTFHTELTDTVDKIFKVDFRNLQSKISQCDKRKALEVLQKLNEENQQ